MFEGTGPRIFALPPGCDFPSAVVAGLRARLHGHPPEAMARVTLYVNTNRMQARITDLFVQSGASFLPKLRLITQLAEDPRIHLAQATSPLRRLLEISNLVSALLAASPDMAPRAAVFDLAVSLNRLLDEMQGEDVTPQAISSLDVAQHSAHWERAQAFLRIVTPLFYGDDGPENRRHAAVAALRALWGDSPPPDPVIIAGTTGSRKATAEFMQAVCALPQGAVILPGYDFDLPQDVWQQMDDALAFEDHPQFRFRRLMDRIGFAPHDVQLWNGTVAPSPARNALVSLSLRPAPVTDQWLRDGPNLPDLLDATRDLTLIEAPFARSEALAIALILRQAAEQGVKAALITPDRNLSRQVTAALDRWGILPDDSAGQPLALSAAGRFLRHTLALMDQPLSLDRLIIVLKHPLAFSGAGRGAHLLLLRELEVHLRRYGPAFPDLDMVSKWAMGQSIEGAANWVQAIAPLFSARKDNGIYPLASHIAAHIQLSEQLARGTDTSGAGALWQAEAGQALHDLVAELSASADAAAQMTWGDYHALFETILQQRPLRAPQIAHPNILIWGTIEARVQGCDLVVLGGLNDAIWPKLPEPDPWLNRKMRKDAGLLLPDRQIGLAAHDYQQAIGAPRVVLTRAMRNADSETIPSRWLNRLTNLMAGLPEKNGPKALAEMQARGDDWLHMAAALDRPSAAPPNPRPAPAPPVSARPRSLSVTGVEHLITNPYHVYARYILNLRPLPPLRAQADSRDYGMAVHLILETFVKSRPPEGEAREAARNRLSAIAETVFTQEVPFPALRIFWLAKFMHVADFFLAEDGKEDGVAQVIESKGLLKLPDLDFTLTAKPDRIDRLANGKLHLIDYKSTKPPTQTEQSQHRKQLLLTALIAQNGGFTELGPSEVEKISYIALTRDSKTIDTPITETLLAAEEQILHDLVAAYLRADTGYTARRASFKTDFAGDYDHLMRFGEWQTSDPAVLLPVGRDRGLE